MKVCNILCICNQINFIIFLKNQEKQIFPNKCFEIARFFFQRNQQLFFGLSGSSRSAGGRSSHDTQRYTGDIRQVQYTTLTEAPGVTRGNLEKNSKIKIEFSL